MKFKVASSLEGAQVIDTKDIVIYNDNTISLDDVFAYIKEKNLEPVPILLNQSFILESNVVARWNLTVHSLAYDHLNRFDGANLEKPIVVLSGTEVLDGMHRCIKGLQKHVETIPGYVLTNEDMDAILNKSNVKPSNE